VVSPETVVVVDPFPEPLPLPHAANPVAMAAISRLAITLFFIYFLLLAFDLGSCPIHIMIISYISLICIPFQEIF
jgi:hypothetical protein